MTEIGSVIDGKYEILKQIGKGGMSVVYLAMDKKLNKQWAVKEIRKRGKVKDDEIAVNGLLAEANLMKRLDHPALPRIVDIIDSGQTIYVVMDYIEGESLDKILEEYGAQPEEIVIEWAKQICDAFSYLHSQNPPIIYRDMKPGNIMLKPEGNLKVIDFGIAREYKEQNLSDTVVLGTKGYASPEHYGARQTDARSDIFTLGMTLHHLLTGIDPRPADYRYVSVRQWNPELSDGIEAIIDKCTALDPKDRYQNCEELMYDLEHPDVITKGFKKKQKRKLLLFNTSWILAAVLGATGFGCNAVASNMNHNTYENLVSISTATDLETKIESYKKAIAIYPADTTAYTYILESYETAGRFGKKENDEFLALYNAHRQEFDQAASETAELNYKIGTIYFNYYTNDQGEYSFAERVQKAHPFFETNYRNELLEDGYENKRLSDCYYQICSFYKTYILSAATVEEASRDDYLQLFEMMKESLDQIADAGAYDQLTFYNGVFMLLYDQRANMESVNVESEYLLELMDTVYLKAQELTVQKEQSKALKDEIEEHYEEYRGAIQRTYSNASERALKDQEAAKE